MKFIISLVCLLGSIQLIASENNVYDFSWLDQDKEVYVLQNRKFRKNKKVYLGLLAGSQINGAFIDSNEFSAHGGFFFKEEWGVELFYTSASGSTNNTHDGVNEQGTQAFYRKVDTSMGASFGLHSMQKSIPLIRSFIMTGCLELALQMSRH